MPIETWLLFLTTVFFLSMTPGPNMMLAMTHGMIHGPARTLATGLGEAAALLVLMAVSATGLGAVLAASETAFQVVKWAGVAYLLWLGVKTWRSDEGEIRPEAMPVERRAGLGRLFLQGFLVSFGNPKAIMFFAALFPQFLRTDQPLAPQLAVMAATFAASEVFWVMTYAGGAHRIAPWLRRAGHQRLVNRLSGGVLLGAAALLAATRR
ncbi:LysE family translocator [Telmatospirillum sp. J64-1]|uniref:LysE family translocator n=1 Tax=Telmatospirillum sp. J64-1 TaxID=2502183 RepID=UPI00115DB468|nr:LysE family translocator [Telmatospirillum sp. J64-1]